MSVSSSPVSARRRPCELHVGGGDSGNGQRATATTVDRLLTDIAFQWQREQQRSAGRGRRRRRRHRNDGGRTVTGTSMGKCLYSVVAGGWLQLFSDGGRPAL